MRKAKTSDVGVVLVRNTNHLGAAGLYALEIAEAGMIGTIYSASVPSMTAPGSIGAVVGTSVRAYSAPRSSAPFVVDLSLGHAAGLKIRLAAQLGEEIPVGWIVDRTGRPTTNPADYLAGGAHVPIGGHKGYGMALFGELLTGALTGAAMGGALAQDDYHGTNLGFAIFALNVEAFMSKREFATRVATLVEGILAAPQKDGPDKTRIPGERAHEIELVRRREGIPIDNETWSSLCNLANELQISEHLPSF